MEDRAARPAALSQAILHMRRAVDLNPGDPMWRNTLASYYDSAKQHDSAVAEYRIALHLTGAIHPVNFSPGPQKPLPLAVSIRASNQYDSLTGLGDALVKNGKFAAAVEPIRQALLFNPNNEAVLGDLGYALNSSGRQPEARAAWKRRAALAPPYTSLGRSARQKLAERS